jgi:redox-sensing transcriptional repressor
MVQKRNIKKPTKCKVPEPSLKRLPVYLHYLKAAYAKGNTHVSAPKMGADLLLDHTQIVKDLSITGVKGKPKIGYAVIEVIQTIEDYLGFNKTNEAFLVGAGNLGQALLSYSELQGFGIHIIAAFDVDAQKLDTTIGSIKILHFDKLGDLANRLNVSIGILTTPVKVAQQVAEAMVQSGIKAIWNFTPVNLQLPDEIIVQNTSMYANVAVLLKKYHSIME